MDVSDEIVPLEESFQELDFSEHPHQPENEVKTQGCEKEVPYMWQMSLWNVVEIQSWEEPAGARAVI